MSNCQCLHLTDSLYVSIPVGSQRQRQGVSVEYMYVIYRQNSFYEGICYQIKLIQNDVWETTEGEEVRERQRKRQITSKEHVLGTWKDMGLALLCINNKIYYPRVTVMCVIATSEGSLSVTCLYSQSWVSGSGRALTWLGRRHRNTAEAKMLCSYSQKNYAHKLLLKVLAGQIPHVERPRFRRLTSAHKHTQLHTYSHGNMQSVKALISSQQNNHSATLS